jgi:hypothetical protein
VQDGRLPCMHFALLQHVRAINPHTGSPASKCSKCELNAIEFFMQRPCRDIGTAQLAGRLEVEGAVPTLFVCYIFLAVPTLE